jgi:hypothetical protein
MTVGNYTPTWDSAIWDNATWAKYSATWDNAVWDFSDWNWVWRTEFGDALTQFEKYSGIQTVSDCVCEPGMDIITSPMKKVIEDLEKI